MQRGRPLIAPPAGAAAAAPSPRAQQPTIRKGGMDVIFHAKIASGLCCVVAAADNSRIAAATDEGVVVFINGLDINGLGGTIQARCEVADFPPNAMAFSSAALWLVVCTDDGYARVVASDSGKMLLEHAVAEESVAGKRPRRCAADHCIAFDDVFVAAAGRLVHACRVPEGQLEHARLVDKPIRALCSAPPALAPSWAYAAAFQGGIMLVSRGGEIVCALGSEQPLRSLALSGRWLAAAAFDGTVELWDVAGDPAADAGAPSQDRDGADHRLQAYCGSDGQDLQWSADGSALAMSGKKAAAFDFTGANPAHPYRRRTAVGSRGTPDPVPRVCLDDGHAQLVAWAPPREDDEATSLLATVGRDGAVRTWQPQGGKLRKGGNGNPEQPERMKPQFYTFVKHDAAHPSGVAVGACALLWLSADMVVVGYENGDLVTWRLS